MMHLTKYRPETTASPSTSFTLGPARDDLRACGLLGYCALILHHLRGHFCIESQSVHPASPRYVLLLLNGYRDLGAKLSPNQSTKNQFQLINSQSDIRTFDINIAKIGIGYRAF